VCRSPVYILSILFKAMMTGMADACPATSKLDTAYVITVPAYYDVVSCIKTTSAAPCRIRVCGQSLFT
jgi:hypothetical protein